MKIKEINIIQFGKLKDFNLRFEDGCNIIYGENEAGKSTIQIFIKIMLYGCSGRKGSDKLERKKALPWDGSNAEGSMTVETDRGLIKIYRRIGKTARGDELKVFDVVTGEELRDLCAGVVGENLICVPEQVFEKTAWIRQDGSFMGGAEEEITKRLINISQTGSETLSAESALQKLDEAKKSLRAKDRRGVPGVLDTAEQEQWNINQELQRAKQSEQRRKEAQQQLEQVTAETEKLRACEEARSLQAEVFRGNRLGGYIRDIKEIESSEAYRLMLGVTEDKNKTIEESFENCYKAQQALQSAAEPELELERQDGGNGRVGIIAGAVLMVLGLLGMISISFLGIFMIFSVILIALGAFLWFNSNKNRKKYMSEMEKRELERQERELNRRKSEELYNSANEKLNALLSEFNMTSIEAYRSAYTACLRCINKLHTLHDAVNEILQGDSAEQIMLRSAEAAKKLDELPEEYANTLGDEQLSAKLKMLSSKKLELENALKYEFKSERSIAELQSELSRISDVIETARKKYGALEIAQECLQQALRKMRGTFGSQLNDSANKVIDLITDGKYKALLVGENYQISLMCADGTYKEAEYFSGGTYDQVYFSLRMALSELIIADCPVFLDDTLRFYDDSRAERTVKYLAALAERTQIFLFTCGKREVDVNHGENINIISL